MPAVSDGRFDETLQAGGLCDRSMSARSLCVLALALFTTGCVNTVSIDVDDSTRFSQLAGSIPLDEESSTRLRFRRVEVSGDDGQRLDAGERIAVGDTAIRGPGVVDLDLDLTYYSVAVGSEREQDNFKYISYLGISHTDFELTLTESGGRFASSDHTTELYLQVGFSAEIAESLNLGITGAFSLGRYFSGISEFDLTLDYELASRLVLSGGYRWFAYGYDEGNEDSNLEVEFRGPFIGLYLPF